MTVRKFTQPDSVANAGLPRTNWVRNNTMLGVVAGSPGTQPTNWGIPTPTGCTRTIVGVGVEDGISYVDVRWNGTCSATGQVLAAYPDNSVSIPAVSGETWTSSFYVKLIAGSLANLSLVVSMDEKTAVGGYLSTPSVSPFVPDASALSLQRYTNTSTLVNVLTARVLPTLYSPVANGAAIDVTLRIGMPQMEESNAVSAVIPTSGFVVTVGAIPYAQQIENALAVLNSSPLGDFAPYASSPVDMKVNIAGGTYSFDLGIKPDVTPFNPWTTQTTGFSGAGNIIYAIAYGAGLFVIAGQIGGNALLQTSPDGITWTTRTTAFGTNAILSVLFANGIFVAVGELGNIATSTDGITWTARTPFFANQTYGLAYGAGLWVITSQTGGIATSSDGITWTGRTSPFGTSAVYDVIHNGSLFMAVAAGGKTSTSSDGITWSSVVVPAIFGAGNAVRGVAYGDGLWVIVGGNVSPVMATSPDGTTWTTRTSELHGEEILRTVEFANGIFIAGGDEGVIISSPDGITWTTFINDVFFIDASQNSILKIRYFNSLWLGAGDRGIVATSSDPVSLQVAGTSTSVTTTTIGALVSSTLVAPVNNPRIDRIAIDVITGTLLIIQGVEALTPVAPAYPDGVLPIGQISLSVGQTAITGGHITDERWLINTDDLILGVNSAFNRMANYAVFEVAGTFAFTKPSSAKFYRLTLVGAGGSSGGSFSNTPATTIYGGGAGGGGAMATLVTLAEDLTITVGAQAAQTGTDNSAGGVNDAVAGSPGGDTTITFASGTVLSVNGGNGGGRGVSTPAGGAGGAGGVATHGGTAGSAGAAGVSHPSSDYPLVRGLGGKCGEQGSFGGQLAASAKIYGYGYGEGLQRFNAVSLSSGFVLVEWI